MLGLLVLSYTLAIGGAPPVGAQTDPTSCGHYETQEDATEALHSGEVPNPENLDPDGDGIACEMRWPVDPDSPPPVYEPTSCGHFETQEDAQAAFDSGELPDPENLDADGDGIVCEFRWGEGEEVAEGPIAVDPTTCGHFENQADAQEALESGTLPHPEYLDGDSDGIACEDVFDTGDGDDGPAVALPSTGSGGAVAQRSGAAIGGLVGLALAVACAGLMVRRHARGGAR